MNINTLKLGLKLTATGFCLLLAGCATTQYYDVTVHSWDGATVKSLTSRWGYPDRIQRLPSGNRLYVYRTHVKGKTPITTIPGSTYVDTRRGHTVISQTSPVIMGGETYELNCKTFFEIGRSGRVVNTSFRGNDCTASKGFVAMYGNPRNMPKLDAS